jgi:uncharacterized membrane protein
VKTFVCAIALCIALPAQAETVFPHLHSVTGVPSNDVLNLRAEPAASAALVGSLAPGATGIEVTGLSPDGKWGMVSFGESTGWASMAYLAPSAAPPWYDLQSPLTCIGTEPFWSLTYSPETKTAHFTTPEEEGPEMDVATLWPGQEWRQTAAFDFRTAEGSGMAVIRAEACSDGMSDARFGLRLDAFVQGTTAAPASQLNGCCKLAP